MTALTGKKNYVSPPQNLNNITKFSWNWIKRYCEYIVKSDRPAKVVHGMPMVAASLVKQPHLYFVEQAVKEILILKKILIQ